MQKAETFISEQEKKATRADNHAKTILAMQANAQAAAQAERRRDKSPQRLRDAATPADLVRLDAKFNGTDKLTENHLRHLPPAEAEKIRAAQQKRAKRRARRLATAAT